MSWKSALTAVLMIAGWSAPLSAQVDPQHFIITVWTEPRETQLLFVQAPVPPSAQPVPKAAVTPPARPVPAVRAPSATPRPVNRPPVIERKSVATSPPAAVRTEPRERRQVTRPAVERPPVARPGATNRTARPDVRRSRDDDGDRRRRYGSRGTRFYWGPGAEFYFFDGFYHGDCSWLRRKAAQTGSNYWRLRYRQCRNA